VVGAGAACAVGGGAVLALGGGGTAPAPDGSGTTTSTPTTGPDPTRWCGLTVADLVERPGDVTARVGLPIDMSLGTFVGRDLGPELPVWIDVPADAGLPLSTVRPESAEVVLTQDGVVVGVVDARVNVVALDPVTDDGAEQAAPVRTEANAGTGAMLACDGGDLPAGEYLVQGVVAYTTVTDGAAHRIVSADLPVTLGAEVAPLVDGLATDYPTTEVPVVGGTLVRAREMLGGGWEVTVAVTGDDPLMRAATLLGYPKAGAGAQWRVPDDVTFGSGDPYGADTESISRAFGRALDNGPGRGTDISPQDPLGVTMLSSSDGTDLSLLGRDWRIEIHRQTGADGGAELRYRVWSTH
jgi:hypothetical protein